MSHEIRELKSYPVRRFEGIPRGFLIGAGVLVLLGVIAFALTVAGDADRAWRAYLFNWIFFAGIAQGAIILGVIVTIAKGVWSRPIRRVALSFVAFLPIAYLLLFPPILIWGADHIFPWIHHLPEPIAGKAAYLNMPFLTARNFLALGVLLILSLLFAYWALRPDAGHARDAGHAGYDRLMRGWRGQEAEELRAHHKLSVLSPVLALVYALAWSFVAWDLVMSLDPHWFSTLFGPYVFMGAFLGGLAVTILFTLFYRNRLSLHEYIEGANLHDIAKLTFAFCVFWAYLFWAQYIVIWYGNLPLEQIFFVNRLRDPYQTLTITVFFMMFVVPFFGLLGVKPKKTPAILGVFAGIILLGLWFERFILVYPTLYPGADTLMLGLPEIGIALGFAGLFVAASLWFAARYPILQVWQPASELELMGVEVEETAPSASG